MAQTVKYDGEKRAKEIAEQVYKDIGGKNYRPRKRTNRVMAASQKIARAQNANSIKLAAIGRELDSAEKDETKPRKELGELVDELQVESGELEDELRDLAYQQGALLLEDETGDQIDVEVLKDEVDFEDLLSFFRDLAGVQDETDPPTKPAE